MFCYTPDTSTNTENESVSDFSDDLQRKGGLSKGVLKHGLWKLYPQNWVDEDFFFLMWRTQQDYKSRGRSNFQFCTFPVVW